MVGRFGDWNLMISMWYLDSVNFSESEDIVFCVKARSGILTGSTGWDLSGTTAEKNWLWVNKIKKWGIIIREGRNI